jgi:hypothetical protein
MKSPKKKVKSVLQEYPETLENNELKSFVEAVSEELQIRMDLNPDAFEAYFHTKCHRWTKDTQDTCSRIESGYNVILKELQQK